MYTVIQGESKPVDCPTWALAEGVARAQAIRAGVRKWRVAPVAIWHENGTVVAVVTDDANAVTVHRLYPNQPRFYQEG